MRFLKEIRENEYAIATSFRNENCEVTTELFLHLEIFVCRILVTVDLHIRDMPFFRRSCLIDFNETLRKIRE